MKMDMSEEEKQEQMNEQNTESQNVDVREDPEVLAGKVKELQGERDQLNNRLLRAMAEVQNTQKRAIKDRQDAVQRTELMTIERFVFPVIDDLDRALKAAGEHGYKTDDPLYHGVSLVVQHIFASLKQINIEPIDADGKHFDPLYHEAIMEFPVENVPENTVVQVLTRGYTQEGRTIRPARVAIAKKKAEPQTQGADEAKYQDDGEKTK